MSDHIKSTLVVSLEVAVPLWVERIRAGEVVDAPSIAQTIAEKGDVLMFGSKRKGEQAAVFNELAKGIAMLSFCPGGVTTFGLHFESFKNLSENVEEKA